MKQLKNGLEKDGQSLSMVPSFVTGVPTGNEIGTYLTLDLGGTNLRVCKVILEGGRKIGNIKGQLYEVSEDLKTGDVTILFDFIADCVKDLLLKEWGNNIQENDKIDLGFTFSFPVIQTAIDKGILLKWTKGFTCTGAVGNDIISILQKSLDRKSLPVKVTALINDTVGIALAHAYYHSEVVLGAILGTGTNGAYFEQLENIKKLNHNFNPLDKMIINIEWGAFDSEKVILPITQYDNKLDKESNNPNSQIFEKLISGMYLGEITRNIMLYLIDRSLLFNGLSSENFNKHYIFETKYMSIIESDNTETLENTKQILENLFHISTTSLTDRQIVKRICQLVGIRASRLSSLALASIISYCKMEKSKCCVGIDGSLFEKYPNFSVRMHNTLKEFFGENADKIGLHYTSNGSSIGAALAALLANQSKL
ncbi:10472_t:CDS:2 [Diversispora eburnea]|uniref:Phosphotransferase n=1 Tax=Diversispora eburnea TaxID=1213867 RepID=A0A9N8YZ18_9GLOM|nr:10472_t:CDS:2 [Diversispora eburnea]